MLAFARRKKIYLTTTRMERSSVLAANPKEDKFGYVPKVKPNTSTIRATIFADLVPNNVTFVCKPPRAHHRQPVG
jgi:hypothetical protein